MKTEFIFKGILPCVLVLWFAGCRRAADDELRPAEMNRNEIVLSREAIADGAIRTAPVRRGALSLPLETTGEVTFNSARLIRITAKTQGRIESMAAFPGDRVRGGTTLAELFSPEFLSAQAELLQLESRVRQTGALAGSEEMEAARRLLAASCRRLAMMGLKEEEISRIRQTGEMMPLLPVRAPFAGSILENSGVLGAAVETGSVLITMADLSTVWVATDILEKNLSAVRIGSSAEIKVSAYADQSFHGRLTAVGDQVDGTSRSVKARVEVPNPCLKLKPGMFATVILNPPVSEKIITVPEMSLRTVDGKTVVFIQVRPGVFSGREVRTGRSAAGRIEILDGLKEGETVAVDGSFILKSEALKSMLGGE